MLGGLIRFRVAVTLASVVAAGVVVRGGDSSPDRDRPAPHDEPHRSPIALALSADGSRLLTANQTAGTVQQLRPALAGGARSLGNPTLTFVTLPNGTPALVFTCFVFSENANSTPPGGHLFVYPLR